VSAYRDQPVSVQIEMLRADRSAFLAAADLLYRVRRSPVATWVDRVR